VVECPLFDGCYTQGKTIDEALKNIREVLEMTFKNLNISTPLRGGLKTFEFLKDGLDLYSLSDIKKYA
jgi:hypothetical protein